MTVALVRGLGLLAAASLAWLAAAQADVLLAQTVTMTAAREAVRVYLQEVTLGAGEPPYAVELPGSAPLGPMHATPMGDFLFAAVRSAKDSAASIGMVSLAGIACERPEVTAQAWRRVNDSAGQFAGLVIPQGGGAPRAVVVSAITEGALRGLGRIETWECRTDGEIAIAETPAQWLLPGTPVAAVTYPVAGWTAILCKTPIGGTVLHVRDVVRGRVVQERVPIASAQEEVEPAGLALVSNGKYLVALLNEAGVSAEASEGKCWAVVLDANTFTSAGDPQELPGLHTSGAAIVTDAGGGCWIATRVPSAGFAYASRLEPGDTGFGKVVSYSFTGVSQDVLISPAPAGNALALGIERRLEVWPDCKPGGASISYSAPIRALLWYGASVIAAEANRVHGVRAADCGDLWMAPLQTGQVAALRLMPAPPGVTADLDHDRLPDTIDPEPDTPSPRLAVPSQVNLHAEAAGREVRAIRIDASNAADAIWHVSFDAERSPWLRVFPRQGRVPGWFVVGVDPSQDGNRERNATLEVALSGTASKFAAAGSPQRIDVHVEPRSDASRAVLWLFADTNDGRRATERTHGRGALFDLLAAAPFYWSQVLPSGSTDAAMAPYAAVVLESAAIDKGIVSRQALLDYVANGGGLLVIASGNRQGIDLGQRWLAPIGIGIDSNAIVNGPMQAVPGHPLTRHWERFELTNAARLRVDESSTVIASVRDVPALVVRAYGRGRIAVLASASPLEADALTNRDNRLFAEDLFDWLSRAVLETADLDGDGLPDALEDRNDNGLVDPGETSKLDPDSDGDGVPDGKEDANSNGRVDDGETSPLNPDTDGDGDLDGADYDPVPPLTAPVAASLLPATGPAEGGTRVQVDGRNLGTDAKVWFGTRAAKNVASAGATGLVVESPPSELPEGGAVDVRVENAGTHGTVLPGGYVYTARSAVTLGLQALVSANAQYEGSVTLHLAAPEGVRVGRVSLRLDTEPPGQLEWFDLRAGADSAFAGRRTVQRETKEWGIAFDVTPASRQPDGKSLAVVQCRARQPLTAGPPVALVIRDAEVAAPNGELLNVDLTPAMLEWYVRETPASLPAGDQP